MWRDYEDIIQLAGMPLWYDDNGAPRYQPFRPDMLGVYDETIAYLRIACQYCNRQFEVAVSWTKLDLFDREKKEMRDEPRPKQHGPWMFHYGDPPRHGCVGDTMNSEPIAVLQFWVRDYKSDTLFRRIPEEEIVWPMESGRTPEGES